MLPALQKPAPTLAALPGHWLRLDGSGRVLGADAALGARLGPSRQGAGEAFLSWLAPASQALWSTSLWPTLLAAHSLNEAPLDLAVPPAAAAGAGQPTADGAWPVLSSWRAEAGDGPPTFIGLFTPGLERRRLLAELRQARDSLESMPGAVLQLAPQPGGGLAFPYASGQLLDLFGVTPAQALAQPERLLAALTPACRAALEAAAAEALANGTERWLVVLAPLRQPQRRLELAARRSNRQLLWHGVVTDVSERETLQHELRQRAETDALTRLPNRSALLVQLRLRLDAGLPFALLFMDCDRFKQINDSLGHEAGDEVLRHLAQRLRHGLRPADTLLSVGAPDDAPLAARLGGDEFVVIADGVVDAEGVAAIGDRLVRTMAQPYKLRGMELMAPVSVGVMLATPGSVAEQMLRDADTAMYEAKRRGRGSWVLFEPEMHDRVAKALALESDLRQALKAGQLRAAFQPIIEIASGRVVGLEALARWQHPVRGEVSPAQFIPVAEESGLIAELGETMLRMACSTFAAWRRAGLALPARLSVNLSRAQLTDHTLPLRLRALLDELGLPSQALQLEVTESLAMDNSSVRQVLGELRALGVQLALDDFGTGHSSLASLQHFPVQQVKIDRAFVQEIETSAYHRALVQAALQVAQALGLEAVAEGVETATQARLLAELGCTRAQGWLYARALEADAVPAFLASTVPRYLADRLQGPAAIASVSRAHHVVVTDAQGLTVHVNAAFTLNTGYTLDDMRGRPPGALLHGPDTDARAVRLLHDAQVNGTGCLGVETVNYRKGGRPFHVLIDIEPVRDASGRIVQFVSLQTEISDHKRTERELADLRLRFGDVQAIGLVGLWERDLVTGLGQGDRHTLRMLGLDAAAPLPTVESLRRLLSADALRALDGHLDEMRAGAVQGLFEITVLPADGAPRDLQVHWTRRGERLLGVMVDVSGSARRQAEQLRLLRQIELAATAADQFFWVHDQRTGRVTWMPEGKHPFVAAHDTPADAHAIFDTVLPEDHAIVRAARERALAQPGMVEASYRVRAPDGRVRTLLTRRIGLPGADGRVQTVVGVSIDVTPAATAR
ncbi:MAG: EAL domain-containing protein [Rubrivivax sp.]|nr:EAL domain-containing protein [Rubrivivax sp.]